MLGVNHLYWKTTRPLCVWNSSYIHYLWVTESYLMTSHCHTSLCYCYNGCYQKSTSKKITLKPLSILMFLVSAFMGQPLPVCHCRLSITYYFWLHWSRIKTKKTQVTFKKCVYVCICVLAWEVFVACIHVLLWRNSCILRAKSFSQIALV